MTTSTAAPFAGLRPFGRVDAPWFFGRTSQTNALRDRLDGHRFLAVVGGSGVGKSSLVYAGLLPKLEEEGNWWFIEMVPRGAPRDALAKAFVSLLFEAGLIGKEEANSAPLADHVRTTLRRSAFGIVDLMNDWLPSSKKRVLILVDQFEEIFRFEPKGIVEQSGDDEAAAFVSSLLTAAATSTVPVQVIVTMRADYIGDCIRFDGLPEAVSAGQYLVPRLTREQIELVIRQPVLRAGAEIDHDLVEQLLNDSAKQPDALPVLQHVLMRLWEVVGRQGGQRTSVNRTRKVGARTASAGQRRLTIDAYDTIGGMRDALSRHADSVIDDLARSGLGGREPERRVEAVMRALTEVDHRGRGIRRPIPFLQLVEETGFDRADITNVVEAMRADGLSFLRPGPQVTLSAATVIDIGHEALIRLWRKIEDHDALDKDRRPSGWLRAEESDGRIYRALLEYAEESERSDAAPLPPGQAQSRAKWWSQRPRTPGWAKRYGGGREIVLKLIQRSLSESQVRRSSLSSVGNARASEAYIDESRHQAREALAALRGMCNDDEVRAAKVLVETLRNQRDYELMAQLAEAVSRRDPKDAKNRRLYAQCLIETGRATAAIDLLQPLARRLPKNDPEFAEATGLLGRAYKQIFFDAGDKGSAGAREALKKAIETYRGPYELDARNTWHGVNLVALLTRARMLGMRVARDLDPRALAAQMVAALQATPLEQRDEWFLPTLAEASLGLRDWRVIDENIHQYVAARDVKAFQIASTLRQFTEVWDLENFDERGRALVDMLRARLLRLPGGEMRLAPEDLQRVRDRPVPDEGRLEAILGTYGAQTYQWWKTGIERAASVAAIRQKRGNRMGTGFLVRAGDLGREPAEELLVLTNFHVVNEYDTGLGMRPADAEVVFEAAAPGPGYGVAEIVWSSGAEHHDASLLRMDRPVTDIKPLPIAAALPVLDDTARVYVIGHPGGRDLSFSFQDNELLDHEGPPAGQPQIPGVCRLHYRAPTEGGSSGSPVFNSRLWQVIALHHLGGKLGVRRLNGKEGTYGASEGIAMQSIVAAMRS